MFQLIQENGRFLGQRKAMTYHAVWSNDVFAAFFRDEFDSNTGTTTYNETDNPHPLRAGDHGEFILTEFSCSKQEQAYNEDTHQFINEEVPSLVVKLQV